MKPTRSVTACNTRPQWRPASQHKNHSVKIRDSRKLGCSARTIKKSIRNTRTTPHKLAIIKSDTWQKEEKGKSITQPLRKRKSRIAGNGRQKIPSSTKRRQRNDQWTQERTHPAPSIRRRVRPPKGTNRQKVHGLSGERWDGVDSF